MLPDLIIRGRRIPYCVVNGGMGVGVSGVRLVVEVIKNGGLGVLSSAGMAQVLSRKTGKKFITFDAVRLNIEAVKELTGGKPVGINIMAALPDFEEAVRGAVAAGVDVIFSGAGLPRRLPEIIGDADVAIVPIITPPRGLDILCREWQKKYNNRQPDAVVLELPGLAGGHIGAKFENIGKEEYGPDKLFNETKALFRSRGFDFPLIVAGGIITHQDVRCWVGERGADGVQVSTILLPTIESDYSDDGKDALIKCTINDIIIADSEFNPPGSPVGHPFRILKTSPGLKQPRNNKCTIGVLRKKDEKGNYLTRCPVQDDCDKYFCICKVLLAAIGIGNPDDAIFTVGDNAWRLKDRTTVKAVMDKLKGI